jgi:hypothetical protein
MHQPHPDDIGRHVRARRRPGAGRPGAAAHAAAAALVLLALTGCTDPDGAPAPSTSASIDATTEPDATGSDAAGSDASPAPSDGSDAAGDDPAAEAAPPADADGTSAVGALPDGFPADLLPLPAGAEILVASYVPVDATGAGAPYDVSLNVRTTASADEVMALYRGSLTAAGFTETVGTPPAGTLAAQSTYSRTSGEELVVVGVLDRDGRRTVTVGGQVRASG